MVETRNVNMKMYSRLSNAVQFRLDDITEIKDYFI